MRIPYCTSISYNRTTKLLIWSCWLHDATEKSQCWWWFIACTYWLYAWSPIQVFADCATKVFGSVTAVKRFHTRNTSWLVADGCVLYTRPCLLDLRLYFVDLLQPVSEHFCRQIVTDWSLLWSTESNGAGMRVCGRTITNELNDLFSYIQLNSTTRARPDPTGPNRTRPDPSLRQSPRTLSGRGPVGPV